MQALPGGMAPVPMPDKYIAEMIMDRIAASKVYIGGEYTDRSPLDYYYQGTDRAPIHPETKAKLLYVLEMLAEEGLKPTSGLMKALAALPVKLDPARPATVKDLTSVFLREEREIDAFLPGVCQA